MSKFSFKIKRKGLIFYFILLLLVIYFFIFDGALFFRKFLVKSKISRRSQEIENLEADNNKIAEENEDLKSNPETWEKKARELGMQKEGEEVFIFKETDK